MNVLVTDGSYNQTLGIVRALGKKGIDVSVISDRSHSSASLSRYCKQEFLSPHPGDERSFGEFLCGVAQRFDLLIPVGSISVRIVSRHRQELDKLTSVQLPGPEPVFTALNKRSTYEIAEKVGVPIPLTCYPCSFEEVDGMKKKLSYPVVVKALEDTGTHTTEYVDSERELLKRYKHVCTTYDLKSPNLPMIQGQVNGDGYGFFALYQNGELKRSFMHHRIREYPVTGGASSCAESFRASKLKEYGKRILDKLRWHGPCMVEFKSIKGSQDYVLMEVNPKFWGSLDLALACKVDFPYLLCEMARGKNLPYSEDYKVGVKFHWPLSDDLLHVIKKPSSLVGFARDCLAAKSNIRLNDLLPNLWELTNTLRQVIHQKEYKQTLPNTTL
jgi:predicted ATP-grasp superfamily ATP-dependent carboligase